MIKPLQTFLAEIDQGGWSVRSSATDYPENWFIAPHSHEKHQLIYAIEGVMVVHAAASQWTVPPSRGIWMPSGEVHSIRCVGPIKMRSVFVHPGASPDLPGETRAVSVSALLSELIKVSVEFDFNCDPDSREARVLRLILDELTILPTLPLNLPQPTDQRINQIVARCSKTLGMARRCRTGAPG